ncbi:MAG: adenylate/guanylate cyclase domain-containing response regulator [Planctomycetaceae bacterium]|nr:adenylate/guanylate cyclase domain-containing response regulator [Planctomycetaceae bacterium]
MARILIADDNEIDRRMIARQLIELVEKEHHELVFAGNGEEVLEKIAECPIDVLLLDLKMPVMDGAETFAIMKNCPIKRKIPVLILSGATPADVVNFINLGAEDCFLKSNDDAQRELLRARVRNCLLKQRAERESERRLEELEIERGKLSRLVNALFPFDVASQLLAAIGNESHAPQFTIEPRLYNQAAVMFCDIVGFTAYCETEHPRHVVQCLRKLVSQFEQIAERRGLEKIKTIGDSFMAAAGLSRYFANPVKEAVDCGFEFLETANSLPPQWSLRIGIDFGPVVGGIVGDTRFQYDIWGHTVNVAARVESAGEDGAVNLSSNAWSRVSNHFIADTKNVSLKGLADRHIFVIRPRLSSGGLSSEFLSHVPS